MFCRRVLRRMCPGVARNAAVAATGCRALELEARVRGLYVVDFGQLFESQVGVTCMRGLIKNLQ